MEEVREIAAEAAEKAEEVVNAAEETVEAAAEKAEEAVNAAEETAEAAAEKVEETAKAAEETVRAAAGTAQDAAQAAEKCAKETADAAEDELKAAADKVAGTISGVLEGAAKVISGTAAVAVGLAKDAVEKAAVVGAKIQENLAQAAVAVEDKIESMDDYKEELEESYRKRRVRSGDIMSGTVTSVNEKEVYLDLGYASGRIPAEEMSNDPAFSILESVHPGDELTASVIRADDGDGNILLSRKDADDILAWERLKEAIAEKKVYHGKIGGAVKGGVVIYVEGIRGFMPASRLALSYVEDTAPYLNQEIDFRVIEADPNDKRVILSAREVLREKAMEEKNKKVQKFTVGTVLEGKVETLKDYGAFIDLGDHVSGLLHVSQISDRRLKNPAQVLKVGDTVKVKIIKVENNRISLSMREAADVSAREVKEDGPSEYRDEGSITTGLGALLKNIKLN